MRSKSAIFTVCFIAALAPVAVLAQNADAPSATTRYLFDTALLLSGAAATLITVLGLAMRDIAIARPQMATGAALRCAGAFAVTIIAFWAVGFGLAHSVEEGGFLGEFRTWSNIDIDPIAMGAAGGAKWIFEMGLAAIAVLIVSGAAADRVKLWPFLVFAGVLSGLIFPIALSWGWGDGYFATVWRFSDHGGGAVLHASAGAAALAAIFVIGPRAPQARTMQPGARQAVLSPIALLGGGFAAIGLAIIHAARHGHFSTVESAISVSTIAVNTSAAGAAGLLAAMVLAQTVYGRVSIAGTVAGAIGGMVSVSADPLHPEIWQAVIIGGVGGVIVMTAPPFLERFRLDDVAGAVPTHLLCGAWSILMVAWTHPDAWVVAQVVGLVGIVTLSFLISLLIWTALKYTAGVRIGSADAAPAPADYAT